LSCPDWKGLTAWRHVRDTRDTRDGEEPAGYREALAHLDGGCALCRRQALAADPTLMFRAVPVMEIPAAQEIDEVAAMRQAVAAMRTASRMEALVETRRTRQGWWKWASAAMLAVAALAVSSDSRFGAEEEALRAGSRRTGAALSAGSPAAPVPAYDGELLPAGSGGNRAPVQIDATGEGEGFQLVKVDYDGTLPKGFFDI
jgi:hypothetical protein